MPLSALIGAGGSLLGGLLGRKKTVSAEQNSREALLGQAAGARKAAERYGFNPLTLLGVSSAVGPSESANYMGAAVAEAGLLVADAVARQKDAGVRSKIEEENKKLRDQVKNLTLRPKVGGIYAQREAVEDLRGPDGSLEDIDAHNARSVGVNVLDGTLGLGPLRHPFDRSIPQVAVRDPAGVPRLLPKPVADRLDLKDFDQMIVEDYEALYGDEAGQVLVLPRIGDVLSYHGTGKPSRPIKDMLPKPKASSILKGMPKTWDEEREARRRLFRFFQ